MKVHQWDFLKTVNMRNNTDVKDIQGSSLGQKSVFLSLRFRLKMTQKKVIKFKQNQIGSSQFLVKLIQM